MEDRELEGLLDLLAQADRVEAEAGRSGECLSLPRLRALRLDPTRWTPGEWRHAHEGTCRRCQRNLARFEEEPPGHPPTLELLGIGAGITEGSEDTRQHLEGDTCRRCLGLVAWARRRGAARRGAAGVWLPSDCLTLRPPATALSFAPQDRDPLCLQFPVGDPGDEARGTLEEQPGNEVTLTLETRSPRLAGRTISYAVLSAEGRVLRSGRFQMSEPGFEGWIVGQAHLGAEAFRRRLGTSPTVVFEI